MTCDCHVCLSDWWINDDTWLLWLRGHPVIHRHPSGIYVTGNVIDADVYDWQVDGW